MSELGPSPPANRPPMTPQRATRRYTRDFWIAIAVYVVLIFAVPLAIRHAQIAAPLLWVLSVAPALPLLGVIYLVARYLCETDEYQRAMQTRRMLGALGAMLGLCTVYGFAEAFAGAPHFELFLVFPLFCALYGSSCVFIWSAR